MSTTNMAPKARSGIALSFTVRLLLPPLLFVFLEQGPALPQQKSYGLHTPIDVGSGLTVTGAAQLGAIAALMAPDSEKLPLQAALVLSNKGSQPVAVEIDPRTTFFVSTRSGQKHPVSGVDVLLPNKTSYMGKPTEIVPFWIPPGSKGILSMSALNIGKWDVVELRARVRGPVPSVRAVPGTAAWTYLPSITIDMGFMMPPSTTFLFDLAR